MLRSPGSSRPARPMIPEEAELKMKLLGVEARWDPFVASFSITLANDPGTLTYIRIVTAYDFQQNWDAVLGLVADDLVRARIPAGHTSGLARVETFKVDAASVIDTENFK